MRVPPVGVEPCVPTAADGTVPAGSYADGYTLIAGQTYYVLLPSYDPSQLSYQLIGESALKLTSVTLQSTCFGHEAVADLSVVADEWMDEDPDGIDETVVKVTGNMAVADLVLSKTAGAAGAALVHLGNYGALRPRLEIVVGDVGGVLRIGAGGKG
jgi:hypothetical protein